MDDDYFGMYEAAALMPGEDTDETGRLYSGWQGLAFAIVMRSVLDYACALKRLRKNKNDKAAGRAAKEIMSFWESDLFGNICGLSPQMMMRIATIEAGKANNG